MIPREVNEKAKHFHMFARAAKKKKSNPMVNERESQLSPLSNLPFQSTQGWKNTNSVMKMTWKK